MSIPELLVMGGLLFAFVCRILDNPLSPRMRWSFLALLGLAIAIVGLAMGALS